jgi:hypothetical protein
MEGAEPTLNASPHASLPRRLILTICQLGAYSDKRHKEKLKRGGSPEVLAFDSATLSSQQQSIVGCLAHS